MTDDSDKMFTCRWCGTPLAAEEVVPLTIESCCGFVTACQSCADDVLAQREPERALPG